MVLGGMMQNCTTSDVQGKWSTYLWLKENCAVPTASFNHILTSALETQRQIVKLCPHLGDSRTSEMVGVLVSITALALICVALRIISRRVGRVKFGWDDWLIFVAMVSHQRHAFD